MNKYNTILICGPAGCGKDSLVKSLCDSYPEYFNRVVTATTRPIRENEVDGIDYKFLSESEFDKTEMVEATYFNNWGYGTPVESFSQTRCNVLIVTMAGIEFYKSPSNKCVNILDIYYLDVPDKLRLLRQLNREENPNVKEIVRRFTADQRDFETLQYFDDIIKLNNETMDDLGTNVSLIKQHYLDKND